MHRHAIRQLTNRSCFVAAPGGRYITPPYATSDRTVRTRKKQNPEPIFTSRGLIPQLFRKATTHRWLAIYCHAEGSMHRQLTDLHGPSTMRAMS
jgi:hypothetical protein